MGYVYRILAFFGLAVLVLLIVYLLFIFFENPFIPFFGFFLLIILDSLLINYGSKYVIFSNKFQLQFFGNVVYTFSIERIDRIEEVSLFGIPISTRLIRFGFGFTTLILYMDNGFIYALPIGNYNLVKKGLEKN